MLVAPGAKEGYASLAGPDFTNEVCARVILATGNYYNPINFAPDIHCPVMLWVSRTASVQKQWPPRRNAIACV
jgi:hypothetical protein